MNPRYLAYCLAHGRTPDEMRAADEVDWPGGRMAGFTLWIGKRWAEWKSERRIYTDDFLTPDDHRDFDRWLDAFAAEEAKHGPRSSSVTTCARA